MSLGPFELAVILVLAIMIFGVGKLTQLGGALGKGVREFRDATREDDPPSKPEDEGERS
ncbi:MAG: twin-arginine translocase TatA/TatE family subunit [Sphingomonadaceae bacterium]